MEPIGQSTRTFSQNRIPLWNQTAKKSENKQQLVKMDSSDHSAKKPCSTSLCFEANFPKLPPSVP